MPLDSSLWTEYLCNLFTVAPCYNESRYNKDPIITNNVAMWNLSRYNEYFVLSLAVSKNDMMIQMVDKPNATPIG